MKRQMNRMREQAGFGLIEVIVSAAVLALASLAVLAGIDNAQSSTSREKARSVAATLAEQDQETLRSQQFNTLVGYVTTPPAARPVTVDGIGYSIRSSATWYTDSPSGASNCTSSSSDAEYLKISSVVTSNVVGTRIPAVELDSLVSPSVEYTAGHGTLGVKVVNAAGAGVPDVAVTATGPSPSAASVSGTTDASGCVVFTNVAIGTYSVGLNKLGYVDHFGNTNVTVPNQEVAAGSETVASVPYDVAATVNAKVETYQPNATTITNTNLPSVANTVSAINGPGEVGMLRSVPGPAAAGASVASQNLFPFTTKYEFFSGACEYNDPTDQFVPAYYSQSPLPPGQVLAVPPASAVTIRQPPLFVNITKDANGSLSKAGTVSMTATPILPNGETCSANPKLTGFTTQAWDLTSKYSTSSKYGWIGRSLQSGYPEAGVPFGKYTLCFQSGSKKYTYPTAYDATKQLPGTPLIVTSPSWTTGTC